jgi:putative OPT family oligopeptide transporter
MGSALGVFMAMSNLYTILKLGWAFGVVVTAVVLSYVFWNGLRFLSGGRLSQMSILENNCMASTASAAGYSTGTTVGMACGALLLIQGEHLPWPVLGGFIFFSAALGVFLAIPMKRQMVNWEGLPFPTGTAAAETLKSLYGAGGESLRKAYGLLAAMATGLGIGVLRTYGTLVDELAKAGRPMAWLEAVQRKLHLPEAISLIGILNPLSRGQMAGLAFEPSVLLIGAGMMVGTRVALSMLGGSLLLYYVVAPWVLSLDAAHAGNAGYVAAFRVRPDGGFNPLHWSLWGGTSVMVFASLTALALDWRTVARAFTSFRRRREGGGASDVAAVEVPVSWLVAGLIPCGIGMIIMLWLAFHVSIPLGIVAVLLTIVVALVCSRATGETDTTPVGAMGKLTQLLFAVLPGAAGNPTINLMTAGATSGAGMGAADLLTDLKSGYLLGANPRRQFLAQFIGVFIGTLAIVPGWYLMVPTRERLEAFNPPATNMWKAVADLLTQGIQMLPQSAVWLIAIGALVGILLPILDRLFPRARPYLPSAIGLGLSWVMVFQNSLSFALGATLVWIWSRVRPKHAGTYAVPVASGFIAGESLIAAAIAIACTLVGIAAAS